MDKKCKTPQIFLGRFTCGGGTKKRTFRFTSRNASSYFFGTLRFVDYTVIPLAAEYLLLTKSPVARPGGGGETGHKGSVSVGEFEDGGSEEIEDED